MSFGNTTENDLWLFVFQDTLPSWEANTHFYLALHTADPGEAGSQTTSEATHTSYARVAVIRTSAGFTVVGDTASNAALVQFPQCTGGSDAITHATIGTAESGAGQIIGKGALSSTLNVSNGIQPQFAIGALTFVLN